MTLNDMLTELDHFQYSKEHMEMLKLESEINIYESYIESMEFAMMQGGTPLMESGFYIVESDAVEAEVVDNGGEDAKNVTPGMRAKIKSTKESLEKKKNTFKNAIIKIMERIRKIFVSFVNSLKKVFTTILEKIDKLTRLRIDKMSEEDVHAVVKAMWKAADVTKFHISEKGKDYIKNRLSRKLLTVKGEAFQTALKNVMTGPFNITVSNDYHPHIIDQKSILGLFNGGAVAYASSGYIGGSPKKLMNKLERAQDKVRQNGCDIGFSGNIDKYFMTYGSINQAIETIIQGLKNPSTKEEMSGYTGFFTELHLAVSDFIRLNSDYIQFVKQTLTNVAPIFNAKQHTAA